MGFAVGEIVGGLVGERVAASRDSSVAFLAADDAADRNRLV